MSSATRIVLAGATGFLGIPLARAWAAQGADLTVLTRQPASTESPFSSSDRRHESAATRPIRLITWIPDGTVGPWASVLEDADAVVNLAGESLAARRWTAAQKARLEDSRILATRSLVNAIEDAHVPPRAFVSASGIGFYGPRGDEILTERAAPGDDFLARLCVAWEAEAQRAASARTRVVFARTSLVVAADGGALAPMLLPFRLGVGGPIGSGRQYWPWIHRDDWVAMIAWAAARDDMSGGMNVTSPNPVTNAEFARALGRALRRPAFFPLPAFMARLMLGEMADGLILSGQRAIPDKAMRGGFAFRYERLDAALAATFGG